VNVSGAAPTRDDLHLPHLTLEVHREGTRATVRISGELTSSDAQAVERSMCQLVRGGVTEALIDLSDVRELDVAGVAALVLTRHRLRAAHGTLRLDAPSAACRAVLARFHVLSDLSDADPPAQTRTHR
jgi:anti-anti-sigma factor